MKKSIFFICLVLTFMSSCKKEVIENDKILNLDLEEGVWKHKIKNNNEVKINWNKYKNDSLLINIPSEWVPVKKDGILLYIPNGNKKLNLYYSIISYDIQKIKMNINDYIKEGFRQILEKHKECKYIIQKITFEENNDTCYYLEIDTDEDNLKSKTYNLIYLKSNILYDFCHKTKNDDDINEFNYFIFYDVLFSFKFKDKQIIEGNTNMIKEKKSLNLEDL